MASSAASRTSERRRIFKGNSLTDAHWQFLQLCFGGDFDTENLSDTQSEFLRTCFEGEFDPDTGYFVPAVAPGGEVPQKSLQAILYALNADSDSEADSSGDEGDEAMGLEQMFEMNVLTTRKFSDDSPCPEESDCESGGWDLEDLYDFDMEKVAQDIRKGSDMEELTDAIQSSMVETLVARIEANIAREAGGGAKSPAGEWSASRPRLRAQPSMRLSMASHAKLARAMTRASVRHAQNLTAAAVSEIAAAQEEGADEKDLNARIRRPLAAIIRKHRKTILQAGAILEVAGVGVDEEAPAKDKPLETFVESVGESAEEDADANKIDEQMRLVQKAVKGARRRHRAAVAKAVREAEESAARGRGAGTAAASVAAAKEAAAQERINQIITAAYKRHMQEAEKKREELEKAKAEEALERGKKPQPLARKKSTVHKTAMRSLVALMNTRVADGKVHTGEAPRTRKARH